MILIHGETLRAAVDGQPERLRGLYADRLKLALVVVEDRLIRGLVVGGLHKWQGV